MRARTISIVIQGDGHFDVFDSESPDDAGQGLNFDELLGEIARVAAGNRCRYMRNIEDVIDWKARIRERRKEDFEEVPT